ncbi:UNKNOWN [Stylonychia lemnae]|uniref:Uncharacterized protein n=1 Tax=Stylonychia lemnae TaxID=5949 RepID=A0A078B9K6_STYLE|nr:UNKNOWN [Stylonychia lemnae]|eukprot:CDW90248.1 UNKNOWN [Stylonychia lemnae]
MVGKKQSIKEAITDNIVHIIKRYSYGYCPNTKALRILERNIAKNTIVQNRLELYERQCFKVSFLSATVVKLKATINITQHIDPNIKDNFAPRFRTYFGVINENIPNRKYIKAKLQNPRLLNPLSRRDFVEIFITAAFERINTKKQPDSESTALM